MSENTTRKENFVWQTFPVVSLTPKILSCVINILFQEKKEIDTKSKAILNALKNIDSLKGKEEIAIVNVDGIKYYLTGGSENKLTDSYNIMRLLNSNREVKNQLFLWAKMQQGIE